MWLFGALCPILHRYTRQHITHERQGNNGYRCTISCIVLWVIGIQCVICWNYAMGMCPSVLYGDNGQMGGSEMRVHVQRRLHACLQQNRVMTPFKIIQYIGKRGGAI